jgi:hypothetical protein
MVTAGTALKDAELPGTGSQLAELMNMVAFSCRIDHRHLETDDTLVKDAALAASLSNRMARWAAADTQSHRHHTGHVRCCWRS